MSTTTNQSSKVYYTAHTHTTGGREGASKSSDGNLDVKLSMPGSNKPGTNPEQLFAAGWSACFEGAMAKAAQKLKVRLPESLFIDAEIDLLVDDGNFTLAARMDISLPGVDREVALQIIEIAHNICPYSKAIKGNVPVQFNLV
ncbi:peroxiredoxin [Niastella yeongjuensis]|uniref:Peroxiredoxin n=1 Tax=Niastella yeongjuensis TaxID=354355 RepID=A0A1V9EJM3_9BACT|nr:organic hydroperoxide resistance protein [Niastella yeongjuensis]OQP46261.1 peroxiredoxin [Niastella yeongjuensis]SEP46243.1 peroxiredoxin, Ohr subfamily [Niastella yeongjuensis]